MKIKQVYEIVNDAQKQVLGEESLIQEDLSDVVSVGESIANANLYDKFVGALINRIAKNIFSIRAYSGRAPQVLMDSWEFGSIVQKVHGKLPDAEENESWELVDTQFMNKIHSINHKFLLNYGIKKPHLKFHYLLPKNN